MTNDEIKRWCKINNVTIDQLGGAVGLKAGTLGHILNGRRRMTDRTLSAILKVVNKPGKTYSVRVPVKVMESVKLAAHSQGISENEVLSNMMRNFFEKYSNDDFVAAKKIINKYNSAKNEYEKAKIDLENSLLAKTLIEAQMLYDTPLEHASEISSLDVTLMDREDISEKKSKGYPIDEEGEDPTALQASENE